MAIKKRTPVDEEREARIEAFGAAAETPTPTEAPPANRESAAGTRAAPAPAQRRSAAPAKTAGERKADIKPMLVRFDSYEHELLRQVAEAQGRSMHNMAKMILIPALEELRDQSNR